MKLVNLVRSLLVSLLPNDDDARAIAENQLLIARYQAINERNRAALAHYEATGQILPLQ